MGCMHSEGTWDCDTVRHTCYWKLTWDPKSIYPTATNKSIVWFRIRIADQTQSRITLVCPEHYVWNVRYDCNVVHWSFTARGWPLFHQIPYTIQGVSDVLEIGVFKVLMYRILGVDNIQIALLLYKDLMRKFLQRFLSTSNSLPSSYSMLCNIQTSVGSMFQVQLLDSICSSPSATNFSIGRQEDTFSWIPSYVVPNKSSHFWVIRFGVPHIDNGICSCVNIKLSGYIAPYLG